MKRRMGRCGRWAKRLKLAASTVRAIWKAHGLSPHRWRQFKLSGDRAFAGNGAFAEKLHDAVGLYVAPPAHAVVLSVDEPPQIQALAKFRHLPNSGTCQIQALAEFRHLIEPSRAPHSRKAEGRA